MSHVRYINILTWLRGFRVKIANFSSFFCLSIPKRDLDTKKTTPNIEVWPESLGAMLEYWYIERGYCLTHVLDFIVMEMSKVTVKTEGHWHMTNSQAFTRNFRSPAGESELLSSSLYHFHFHSWNNVHTT